MDIVEATQQFEVWLGRSVDRQSDELDYKHRQMASRRDPFPFFRGTYYRWAQLWPQICPELQRTPRVLAVGDLHVENFGTWRDGDGRLIWGINDFDEADELPAINDLVRLAASVWFAKRSGLVMLSFRRACQALLDGYTHGLATGGRPFVLEEEHPSLRLLAMHKERDPVYFWKKLTRLLQSKEVALPRDAAAALRRSLPLAVETCQFRRRLQVGMGSLGKPRFVALAQHAGGWIAREAKALCGPATHWFDEPSARPSRIGEVLSQATRCPDPCYRLDGNWIVRRLAPRCSRIELVHLTKSEDVRTLLTAMGAETANIHGGEKFAAQAISKSLQKLPQRWLEQAACAISEALCVDWECWCRANVERQS